MTDAAAEAMANASASVDQFANTALNLDNLQEEDAGSLTGSLQKGEVLEWREDYDNQRKPERVESPVQPIVQPMLKPAALKLEAAPPVAPVSQLITSPSAPKNQSKVKKSPNAKNAKAKGKKGDYPQVVHEVESTPSSSAQAPTVDNDRHDNNHNNKALESKVIALEREKEGLLKQLSELEKVVSDMGNKDRKKIMEVEEMKIAKAVLARDLSKLSDEVKEKDDTITDLKEKLKGLTEKTREVMKSYSQSKEKVKALEKSEEAATAAKNTISSKEAEILSLKLKLENLDRIVAEQKDAAVSSAEHKQKVKKERGADKETITKLKERVGILEGELSKATTATAGLAEEASKAQGQYELENKALAALQLEFEGARKKYDEDRGATHAAHERILAERDSELENLRMKLGTENEAFTQHEEYKKRAQLALKKSNASASEMNATITDLQSAVESHEAKISILEGALAKEEEARKIAEKLVESGRTEINALIEEMQTAKKAADLLKEETAQLQSANTALSEACEQLEAAVGAKSSMIQDKTSELTQLQDTLEEIKRESGAKHEANLVRESTARKEEGEVEVEAASNLRGRDKSSTGQETALNSSESASQGLSQMGEDGNATDIPSKTASPDQLYYVQTLSTELEELKRENGEKSMEITEGRMKMTQQLEENKNLQGRVEELQNFLNRSKKSTGSEAVTNMEYLKNCVWRFMATTEMSEKKRLFPVISTILNFTSSERQQIHISLQELEAGATIDIAASISNSVSTLFG